MTESSKINTGIGEFENDDAAGNSVGCPEDIAAGSPPDNTAAKCALLQSWPEGDKGPYLYVPQAGPNMISVFDALTYDRSDADLVAPAMRLHLVKQLKKLGFQQRSGNVLENPNEDVRCIIPKAHALGASPFFVADYTPKRAQDYFVLTPTQTACQLIAHFPVEQAVAQIKALIAHQPINILRLSDYLQYCDPYQAFAPAVNHLLYVQRQAIEAGNFRKLKPLALWRH